MDVMDAEAIFRNTTWGRRVVWVLGRYGLPDAVRIEDPETNPWRVFFRLPESTTVVRVCFSNAFVAPSIEIEQASERDAGVVADYVRCLETQYSPAMLPPSLILDIFSRLQGDTPSR